MESAQPNSPALKREVSLLLLTFYGLGTILGAGIYVLIGEIAGVAGYGVPLSLVAAGIVAGLTACCFAFMSRRFPSSAGEAVYVREGFRSDSMALATGLSVILVGITSSATMTVGMVGYLNAIAPVNRLAAIPLTLAILCLVAIWGTRLSVGIAASITVIEMAGLLFIIGISMKNSQLIEVNWHKFIAHDDAIPWPGIMMGAFVAFFAFIGFEDIVNLAEETRDPGRNLPLAIAVSLIVAMILYVLVALAALISIPPEQLSSSKAPLASVAQTHMPSSVPVISFIGIISVINGALVQIIMGSRVLYGMGKQGSIPSIFSRVNKKTSTPVFATVTVTILILILALSGTVDQLATLTSSLTLLIFALVNTACFLVHIRDVSTRVMSMKQAALPIAISMTAGIVCIAILVFFWSSSTGSPAHP